MKGNTFSLLFLAQSQGNRKGLAMGFRLYFIYTIQELEERSGKRGVFADCVFKWKGKNAALESMGQKISEHTAVPGAGRKAL